MKRAMLYHTINTNVITNSRCRHSRHYRITINTLLATTGISSETKTVLPRC